MTEKAFTDWLQQIVKTQTRLDAMHETIINEMADQKKTMLAVLAALAKSNQLLDQGDQVELSKMINRKAGAC